MTNKQSINMGQVRMIRQVVYLYQRRINDLITIHVPPGHLNQLVIQEL